MKAYRIPSQGARAEWQDVGIPECGPDEILVQMTAVGLCRSDLEIMDHGVDFLPWRAPYTLGHENVGWVSDLGVHVSDLTIGESVVVHAASSCGVCEFCAIGRDNFCLVRPRSYGTREDGGLAPYMVARRRDVLPIGSLDHRIAAPLGDAGATAYGAAAEVRPYVRDNGYVVVEGVGGVGSIAVQLLRLLTSATVIAVDRENRLDIARKAGAHEVVVAGDGAVEAIFAITGAQGADAVLELVGTDETLALAGKVVRQLGAVALVGTAGGIYPFQFLGQNFGARVFTSITCSLHQLASLYELAERGLIHVDYETYDFDEIERGYQDLREGKVFGRPVALFAGERPTA